jgi:TonB-linked SusC/RagA family outer membrane protein
MQRMSNQMKKNVCIELLFLLLTTISFGISAQTVTLTGSVRDKRGESVIGATVLDKANIKNGTITDFDGNFTLNASPNATVIVSYIGMKTQEINVAGKSSLDVTLEDDVTALEEVVVIGYGTVKKKDLTGSVSSVQGETLTKVPVTNVAQALTGRLAGVQITTTDGSPDAEMIIRVRGGGSVTGNNSPLYIVDGFPVSSINAISPNDIQSIDVLKDASSTAIYGSQGANGVVMITTKSAKGGKTRVSYNGFMQTKKLSKRLEVLDPYEYVLLNYELAAFDGTDGINSFKKKFGVFEDLELYKYQKAHDWQNDMFGADVISHQHNISITGGSEKTKFSLSSTYNKDGGLMPNNDYERFNVNFKLNHDIAKNLRFNLNARITDTEVNGSGTSGGTYKIRTSQAVTSGAVKGLEEFTTIDTSAMSDEEYEQWIRANMSLAEQASQYWKRGNQRSFYFAGSLDWEIIKSLTYHIEGGYEYGFNETKNYWGANTDNASRVDGKPLVDWTKENKNKVRVSHTLTYNFDLNKDHRFNIMVGQEMVTSGGNNNYMYAASFGTDLSPEKIFANIGLSGGSLNLSSKVNTNENLASFFGRAGYNWNDKYLFTLTMRADGSSKFAPGKQWGVFPAGAFAWRISQEPFMQNTKDWLSNLKLRVSYGEVGNNRISNTLYKLDYAIRTSKTYGLGDKQNNYYATTNSQMANPNLRWETTITRNLGLDFGFMNERFTGTLEYYWNTAKDLLIERNIVAPGYRTMVENIAQTSNKGVELSLNTYILEKKNYSLSANFNIGINKSNIDNLADGLTSQEYASGWAGTDLKGYYDYQVQLNQPVGLIYGWITDGYYTTDDFEKYDTAKKEYILKEGVPTTGLYGGKIKIRPGTLKLKDLDGNTVVDEDDRTIIGKTAPKFTGGFGLNGTLYGFDLSMMFNFVYGNKIYNANKIASTQQYRTNNPNMLSYMNQANRYSYLAADGTLVTDLAILKEMNEGGNVKEYWSPFTFGNAVVLPHSWAVEDGSFLRLQNVTLGYMIPKKYTGRFGCEQLHVYCTANNLWLLTNYTGYDPEVSSPVRGSSASGLTPGVDYSSYPKSFSWTFGVNLTF